jgi:hypothetical protein
MTFAWVILPVVGVLVGAAVMAFGFLKTEKKGQPPSSIGVVDGVLKQDWTRTGLIDFFVPQLESTAPQIMTLRVQERKVTENTMGQDVTEFRWRPATLEEGKEVVARWNAREQRDRV